MTQPPLSTVTFHREGSVGVITLNRPEKLNAINDAMKADLHQVLDLAEADTLVRAILVHGNGRAFSAGFDLTGGTAGTGLAEKRKELEEDFDLIMRFWDSPKPTVSAIHGFCLGGALELAIACDLTIASAACKMGEPEPKFGSGIVAMLLPWLINPKHAKQLLLTGEDKLDAQRAYEIGLINQIADEGKHVEAAMAMAKKVAALDRTAITYTKQAINRSYDIMGMRQALLSALETDIIIESTETPESTEFNTVLAEQGLKAALKWREEKYN